MRKILLLLSVLLLVLLLARHSAPMKVSSLVQRYNCSGSYGIRIWNDSKSPMNYQVELGEWTRGSMGNNIYEADGKTQSCVDWVTLGLERFALSAGESKQIPFIIKFPKKRIKSSRWCILWVSSEARGAGQVKVRQRMGIKLYCQPRKLIKSARITDMKYEDGELTVTIENDGNCEIELESYIQGEEKTQMPKAFILPQYTQSFRKKVQLSGEEVAVIIDFGGKSFLGGRMKL